MRNLLENIEKMAKSAKLLISLRIFHPLSPFSELRYARWALSSNNPKTNIGI